MKKKKKNNPLTGLKLHLGDLRDPVGIRTQDPQLRRLLLYPAELPDQPCLCFCSCGGGWTRTTERIPGQIYSLLQLPLCDSP